MDTRNTNNEICTCLLATVEKIVLAAIQSPLYICSPATSSSSHKASFYQFYHQHPPEILNHLHLHLRRHNSGSLLPFSHLSRRSSLRRPRCHLPLRADLRSTGKRAFPVTTDFIDWEAAHTNKVEVTTLVPFVGLVLCKSADDQELEIVCPPTLSHSI